jgi:hypothetical protein
LVLTAPVSPAVRHAGPPPSACPLQAEGTLLLELHRKAEGRAGAAPAASEERREAFLRENPFLRRSTSSATSADAASSSAGAGGKPSSQQAGAGPSGGGGGRPWTPRTAQREEMELSAAIAAAGSGADANQERLVEASKRVQQEASALRKRLGGRASSGGAGGGGVDPLEVPEQFRCPISQELMEDPVTTSDGHTYERREIFRWLCTHDTSPLTGAPLPNKALTPAIALRQLISGFVAANPGLV